MGGSMYAEGRVVVKEAEKVAFEWFRTAAEQGHMNAQYMLGLYVLNRLVEQDDAVAVHWFRKSLQQGHVDAQNKLDFMREQGRGFTVDEYTAEECCRLGTMYAEGHSVVKDKQLALAWYRTAAQKGHADAQHMLADAQQVHVDAQNRLDFMREQARWLFLEEYKAEECYSL